MSKVLVSGLANLEVSLNIGQFPIQYSSVNFSFFGINSGIGGVGYNIAKALTILGSQVNFVSMLGTDFAAKVILGTLEAQQINTDFIVTPITQTAHSVVLYDKLGQRQVNTDLKDILDQSYPLDKFELALADSDLVILTNIAYSKKFIPQVTKAGKLLTTDLQAISNLDDDYNAVFMQAANILFMSHERLPLPPQKWAKAVINRFGTDIVVVGLGNEGAILALKEGNVLEKVAAVTSRPVVNTVGAGDALFSSFLHFYNKYKDPYQALKKAVLFASYKIGESGSSNGFLTELELEDLYQQLTIG
jgi:ribokinase